MVERFKLAYIGAGSFRFSIGFFQNILYTKELMPMHIALVDIDEKSLNIMAKVFEKMAKKAKVDITWSTHTDRKPALENADFVYKSISVGLQETEWFDNYLPQKFGIPQNTGDTLGPGGIFRAFRTNHVCADIARDMKKICPKAPLLNYTNPQSSIVMAARRAAPDVEFIGLCHELFGGMGTLKKWYNKSKRFSKKVKNWEDFYVEYGGLNHFAWVTKLELEGEDLYPALREDAASLVQKKFDGRSFNFHLLEKYGYFPYPGSRHVAEFMCDYYNYFNHIEQSPYWSFPKIRNVRLLDKGRKAAYFLFKLIGKGLFYVPRPSEKGERAMEMTLDWKNSNPTHHVVNIPNNGTIRNLPNDAIVEIPGVFKDGRMIPAVEPFDLPNEVANLVRPYAEQTSLTVDAALGNSLESCVKAMQNDPMCQWIEDPEKIEALTKLMLYYQQEWLPEAWQEWIPTEDELKASKYWVAPKELKKKHIMDVKFPPKPELKAKAFFWQD